MTTQELSRRIRISEAGFGHKKIEIEYRGKSYYTISNNLMATDRISEKEWIPEREVSNRYTLREAYIALYEEVKRNNHLGEYNY